MNAAEPYLSIVVTSRNDDHGGGLLDRMQTSVNMLLEQCSRHSLATELIVVEWNPPEDRPRLAEALRWPEEAGPCRVRFIEVPRQKHEAYRYADSMPLYQMIAKNAGIRRARGKFVLATNIDILFNDELCRFLAGGRLRQDRMYRIDRHDVTAGVPIDGSVEDRLAYCCSHVLRVNQRDGTFPVGPDGIVRRPAAELADSVIGDLPKSSASAPETLAGNRGVAFGPGWYPVEQHCGQVFRWAEKEAVIEVRNPSGSNRALSFEVEPGPSVGPGPLVLRIIDSSRLTLGQARISKRAILRFRVPGGPGETREIRFQVAGGGLAVPYDPRVRNFRIFRWQWINPARCKANGVEVAPVSARDRLSSSISRLSRILLGLRHSAEPRQIGLPFTQALVRKLGLQIKGGGLSITIGQPRPSPAGTAGAQEASRLDGGDSPVVLHTNACGDFTLMARDRWIDLRGYPEFDAYSFNIDSILCYAAHYAGVREEVLGEPMRAYHIEHGLGSGWTPEGQSKLFERLAAKGIPFVDWPEVAGWASQMRRLNCPMIFNGTDWGLEGCELPETLLHSH